MYRSSMLALGLTAIACGPTSHMGDPDGGRPVDPPPVGATATETIDASGGSVVVETFEISVPAGALSQPTEITVTATGDAVPSGFTSFGPVYRFEPAGLAFEQPVTVRMPFHGDASAASIFWTNAAGTSYVALPTRVEGGLAVAEVTHFSQGFVGTACTGDCCGRANGDLDVLLMVDDSASMAEEQASLAAELPRLARILATGDLDGDGVQDFPALHSLHIGTVSSDMGVGGFTVPTCALPMGDDGVLRQQGNTTLSGCAASYPTYASLTSDDPPEAVNALVQQVTCVSALGTGGCGFEQQLDAVLKAVTPSTSSITFAGGTTGHADNTNAGFVRDGSILATIVLSDENDCSASDPSIFDPTSTMYAGDLNLRCFMYPDASYPVSRYVDGLRALRTDSRDVIFAAITGVPVDLSLGDPATILADPRMTEVIDPTMPNRLQPSCDVAGRGMALPPRRIVEAAQGFGAQGVVGSICQSDYSSVVDRILQLVAARIGGSCG